ncbi:MULTISPECIES: hypothetical protein [Streptomyces]|uniref:hypothetical protein n=1 Tax=Streptomyces TaxID=1883 RepID=UPI0013164278|nr:MULTISPECIES: hypothetical protein [Streptomyces]QGZ51477.1 hypothetical protein GPZ77_26625 [Streptomyces sp. QHH-9511]GGT97682.1 hypothetical protein GCM10010272_48100 [Streptomyces lateritius]
MNDRQERNRVGVRDGGRAQGESQQDGRARARGGAPQGGTERDGMAQGGGKAAGDGRRGEGGRGPLLREYQPPYKRRSGQIAAVLLYRNGGHRVMWPDRHEDTNKPLLGFPYTVFEVRLGRNVTEFDLALPASGDGVFFAAAARVHWEVADPHLVVTQQVWDVAELLRDDLLDGLRAVSRRFRLTDAQRADEAVRDELSSGRFSLGGDIGLRTRVHVFIDLDDSIKEEIGKRDRVGVTMQVDEREMEQQRRRDEGERRRVAERARDLEELFQRGELAQIAHHMAMNPDKEWEIRRELQHEKREGQADFLAVFNRLLDTGVLERHDIGEPMHQVLEFLRESTGTVLGGVAGHVLNPPGGGRRRALEEARPEPLRPPWDEDARGEGPRREDAGEGRAWDDRARQGDVRDGDRDDRGYDDREGEYGRDRPVYEPTRVQSSSERRRDDADGYGERRSRPSADFDDWDTE